MVDKGVGFAMILKNSSFINRSTMIHVLPPQSELPSARSILKFPIELCNKTENFHGT